MKSQPNVHECCVPPARHVMHNQGGVRQQRQGKGNVAQAAARSVQPNHVCCHGFFMKGGKGTE